MLLNERFLDFTPITSAAGRVVDFPDGQKGVSALTKVVFRCSSVP